MMFSVYIAFPSVLTLNNLKLHPQPLTQIKSSEKHLYTRKNYQFRLTFNPGLALTCFRTIRL